MKTIPPVHVDRDLRDDQGIPHAMLCPMSWDVMRDPVILRVRDPDGTERGERYERVNIERWLETPHAPRLPQSPATRRPLATCWLQPDTRLRQRINRTLKRDPVFLSKLTEAQKTAISEAFAARIPKHHAAARVLVSEVPRGASAEAFLQDIVRHCTPRISTQAGRAASTRAARRARAAERDPRSPVFVRPAVPSPPRSPSPQTLARNNDFHLYPVNVEFVDFHPPFVSPGVPLVLPESFGSVGALGRYVHDAFNRWGLHANDEQAAFMQSLADERRWETLLLGYSVRFDTIVVGAQPREGTPR